MASNRAGGETGRKLRKPVQGCGQVMGAGLRERAGVKKSCPPRGPAAEGRLHEFLVESINRTALLSPAILNENQLILRLPPFP